jgi:hypothetical protein
MRGRSEHGSNRQLQSGRAEESHDSARTLQLPELGEDKLQACLYLLVGIEDDAACSVKREPRRQRQTEFASCCFLTLALMEADLYLVEFGLAHDARQAQQQTIVIGAWIVETLAVGDEHAEHRAKLEQLVPVSIIARQARCIDDLRLYS